MAIEFVAVEGACVPLIECDHCKARVRNGDGTVFCRFRVDNRFELDGPHFIHKMPRI